MKKFLLLLIVPLCFFGLVKKVKADSYGYEIRFYSTECYVPIGGDVYDYLPTACVYDTINNCVETDSNMVYTYDYQGIKFSNINTSRVGHGIGYIYAWNNDYSCPMILQKIDVYIYDDVPPIVSVSNLITKRYNEELNILDYVAYSDNASSVCTVELNGEFNPSVIGDYSVYVRVTDESNNYTDKNFVLRVYDDIKPVIECDDVINIGINSTFDKEKYIKVYDEYDGDLDYELSQIDTSSLGEKIVTINAVDSSNNKETKTITIKVLDDIKPTLVLKDYELEVDEDYDYKYNIISVSDNLDNLDISDVDISIKRIGTQMFKVTYKVVDSSFNEEVIEVISNVSYKNKPIIEAINLDDLKDVFDPLYYVNCYDVEDGDLNSKVMVIEMNYDEKYCIYEVYDSDNNLTRKRIDFISQEDLEKYEKKPKINLPTNSDLEQNPINDTDSVIKNTTEYKPKSYNYLYYIILGVFIIGIIIFIIIKHFRKKMV